MQRGQGPTIRRRRLASELRRLREAADLTIDEVGEKLECSASKVSRIETGHVGVTPRDARDMLELYGLTGDEREALVQLAREARKPGWWHAYKEVFTGTFVGLEADASSLRAFQALLVPGLLQTETYARAVIRAMRPDSDESEIQRRVAARTARQQLLSDPNPPEYWAVIDEAVLHRMVGGPEVMAKQTQRLLELGQLPHVTVQVVPFTAGAHPGMEGPFLILGFPEQADPDVVYVDSTSGGFFLELPPDVRRYSLMFDHLRAAALKPDDSLALVAEAAERYSA
ncbi:helix-turn-helix domain-containing protein [Amycolatopsis acidiphila]|uniref:Helix-turn-helix domain-containing protein n=1 Tax=Amycolatopsis acidiphila TaxID=715473 RepID=A0A558A7J7_9PSEU|nr:helix-turn-helix transcriptional regulator [Amycolatopsis acidiphila]TVT20233.1 helix-turn-helix domain-containing protein [Amycolatopsis acidiphila]UIJ58216.1 helix-turn-helix domain-containing protein [Amycolatopsis acidiphila]GHG69358.1 transcriptional regulator [Amycolatopsis acidiphila]